MTNDNSSEKLSVRQSMAVWIGGIMLGWAVAFGLIFSYWAATKQAPVTDQDSGKPRLVADSGAKALNQIKPASGAPAKPEKKAK